MSTTSQGRRIPLHHRTSPAPDASYRLLELPPEVQSALESPTAPVLTLESPDGDAAAAILRTPDRCYALRQKNTSNALLLLSPLASSSSQGPGPCLAAIATVHETVELDAVPEAPVDRAPLKDTGSRGKWHEKFGRGR